jgi:glycerol-3-phosphate dehydrogenase (NAD(P)+)
MPVCVIGAGSWGTALATALARGGRDVRLVAHTAEKAAAMQQARENARYLPGIGFPEGLQVTADAAAVLPRARAVIVATPSAAAEAVLPLVAERAHAPVIGAFKGLHPVTLERSDEVLCRYLGRERVALLSGPSFAEEVARGMPTGVTLAAYDLELAHHVATLFDGTNFRIYTSSDMVGVAIGGALKNVIAIAAGSAEGLHLGHNSVAALITRGIVEISRLAVVCGGAEETLRGLSGLGDLVLTCTGALSRNRRLGMALARGKPLDQALQEIGQVVEGVRTAAAALRLAAKHGVELPITEAVQAVLTGNMRPDEAAFELMARPIKDE